MGLFNKQRTDGATYDGQGAERKGIIDRIKYEGLPDDLVWKFPHDNISVGAQLIVNQSQEAIFVSGGRVADIFGPGTTTLSTNNIPILQKLINFPFGGNTPFTAEVWFISKTVRRNLKFGTTEPVSVRDAMYGNIPIPIRARGDYGISITDSTLFVEKFVGTLHLFNTEDIIEQFKSQILQELNSCFGRFVREEKISVIDLPEYSGKIAKFLHENLKDEFAKFGITLENFNMASISYDGEHPNVKTVLDAQALAAKRNIEGYNYMQERQLDVMETAAGNEGSAGQMMGAGMGLGMGMGIGGAFGTQMGNMTGIMNPQVATPMPPAPPMPVSYHVLINSAQQGPYDLNTLQQLAMSGSLTRDTFVWKTGMPQWSKAAECADLQTLFGAIPPPMPPIL